MAVSGSPGSQVHPVKKKKKKKKTQKIYIWCSGPIMRPYVTWTPCPPLFDSSSTRVQDCPAISSIQVSSTLILHTFLLPPHIQNVMTNITAALSNVLTGGASSEARRAAAVCCLTSLLYVNASHRGQWKHGSVRFSLSLSGCVWFSRLAHKASM